MLDAAHGEAVSAAVGMQRIHVTRFEEQEAGTGAARLGRRRPRIAVRADIVQCSRRSVAEARSRRVKQSLG